MKTLTVALLSMFFAVVIPGADLTGHWVAATHAPDGAARQTSLW